MSHAGRLRNGQREITRGYQLQARHIIHAVGPVYADGKHGESVLLASAYRACLELASQHACASIAFPAISTGVYGYPMEAAARIAFRIILDYLAEHPEIKLVRYVLYDARAFQTHVQILEELLTQ